MAKIGILILNKGMWQGKRIILEYDLVVSFTEENYSTPIVGPWIFKNLILEALQ